MVVRILISFIFLALSIISLLVARKMSRHVVYKIDTNTTTLFTTSIFTVATGTAFLVSGFIWSCTFLVCVIELVGVISKGDTKILILFCTIGGILLWGFGTLYFFINYRTKIEFNEKEIRQYIFYKSKPLVLKWEDIQKASYFLSNGSLVLFSHDKLLCVGVMFEARALVAEYAKKKIFDYVEEPIDSDKKFRSTFQYRIH